MEAKVTKKFPGRPDNEVMTRTLEVGDVISGDLARVAIENGWAEPAEPADVDAGDNIVDLGKLGVEALKALAAERSVDLGEASKKADIIAALQAASAN